MINIKSPKVGIVVTILGFLLVIRGCVSFVIDVRENGFPFPSQYLNDLVYESPSKRFDILKGNGSKTLFYNYIDSGSDVLITNIEKFKAKKNILYLIGYYVDGAYNKNEIMFYNDINTKQLVRYKDGETPPYYTIINTDTSEIRSYHTLDEIPESERNIFTDLEKEK